MRLADLLQPAPQNENWKRTPATVATVAPKVSQLSQLSQGVAFENHFSEVPEPPASPTPDHADLRVTLYRLAEAEGLPRAIVDRLTDADLQPDNGCDLLDDAGLRRWLHVLHENERMQRGMAPPGWAQASHCRRCGSVLLWQGAPLEVLGCPWCHVRRAGGTVARPAITCAACTHQQPRPDTSDAGMHGCAKGHGLHYANATHACDDWRPAGDQQ